MITLVLTEPIAGRLRELAKHDVETGAVLLARLVRTPSGSLRLLGRHLAEVPETAYERRESDLLLITSDGYVPALNLAEAEGCVPIWLHTHPGSGSSPKPSIHDRHVDEQLTDLFRLRANNEFYGAVVMSHDGGRLTFAGHLDDGEHTHEIDRLLVVGDRLELQLSYLSELE